MKLITRFLYLSAAGIMLLTSCAKEQTESYDKFENQALEAWMTQNRRELLKNYQPEGGYYVEILAAGNPDAKPVNDTACWVKFDFSGRDLSGNIILTRNADDAVLAGSFSKYTPLCAFLPLLRLGKLRTDGRDVAGHAPYADARRYLFPE